MDLDYYKILSKEVIEWIPYDKFENIEYMTKGGCSEIFTSYWIDGCYYEWDSKNCQLKRFGNHKIIENANRKMLRFTFCDFGFCGPADKPLGCTYAEVITVIPQETPPEYKKIMEQCWNPDPLKRPKLKTLLEERKNYILHQIKINHPITNLFERDYMNRFVFTSNVYNLKDFETFNDNIEDVERNKNMKNLENTDK
ncbi:hypothetical protein C1645_823600 [Glomus cerebriforme]|uniref:Serine-threonine/tyrosine-protein kinase catalytic domain-containing protein n=1 Tax=Glomus cerebriforme TaxID=658196 RepID=A0A397SX92_9GLOM|nr:hypothetical protein C1645_823600 [Glomus cerebriforme]